MTTRSEDQALTEITTSRYLNYALSVITSRALPDIRDGLKPVQRRILYAMHHDLHLGPDARFKKSAKVVGEVMGNYHPHGDQSIYEAMARMAQSFAMRYPLVEGQGNFGSLDGDPPAAMRYTEAKLAHLATELLEELKQATVDFHPTYDGSKEEPDVLPAQIPNLLINGSSGIAVGMATSIPPHNLREVVRALLALIDKPDLPEGNLVEMIPGPDFPTGGTIINSPEEIREIYATGTGTLKLRGTWEHEKEGRRSSLVITSIPYGVDKSVLVTRIGEAISGREVPQIVDVRDESTEEVRIVCELKSGSDPEAAAAFLVKSTPLQSNVHVNLTCLVPTDDGVGIPQRVTLASMLRAFLGFRFHVVTRRHQHELGELTDRLHVLEGFEKVFADLDRAIEIIRQAGRRADAQAALEKAFKLTERQANAVLDTKLYKLSRLEIADLKKEAKEVRTRVAEIEKILSRDELKWKIVRQELAEVTDAYGDPRRTKITGPVNEVSFRREDYIIDEDAWLVVTREGWIKRQRRYSEIDAIRVREGDEVRWLLRGRARQTATFFSSKGSAYTVRLDEVPMTAGYGEPLGRFFTLADGEMVVGVVCHDPRCLPQAAPANGSSAPVQPPAPAVPARPADDDEQTILPGFSAPRAVPAQKAVPPAKAAPSRAQADGDEEDESGGGAPPGPYAVAFTRQGRTLRFPVAAHAEPSTKNGRLYARLSAPFPADSVVLVELTAGGELVAIASKASRVLLFDSEEISVLSGPGRGVTAIKLEKGDEVLAVALLSERRPELVVETSRGGRTTITPRSHRQTSRAGKGHQELSRAQFARLVQPAVQPVPDRAQVVEQGADDEAPAEGGGTGA